MSLLFACYLVDVPVILEKIEIDLVELWMSLLFAVIWWMSLLLAVYVAVLLFCCYFLFACYFLCYFLRNLYLTVLMASGIPFGSVGDPSYRIAVVMHSGLNTIKASAAGQPASGGSNCIHIELRR